MKFRIIEIKEIAIYARAVVNERYYIIQEFKRGLFGLGKKKWKNYKAIDASYAGDSTWGRVIFGDLKDAKKYIKGLKEFYNKKIWREGHVLGGETSTA